jgi:putative intracellular protease/amidase
VDEIDCIYLAGGHGTCVDFPTDEVGAVVSDVYAKGKVGVVVAE